MKANKFIEKFGWDAAIRVVSQAPKSDCAYSLDLEVYLDRYAFSKYEVYIDDLKRIVESYELVKNHNGISPCKFWVSMMDGCDAYQNKVDLFKRAIADVESINDY